MIKKIRVVSVFLVVCLTFLLLPEVSAKSGLKQTLFSDTDQNNETHHFDPNDPCGTGKPGLKDWEKTIKEVASLTLAVTMAFVAFTFGCGTDFELLKTAFKKPIGLSIGVLCQFIVMPSLAFLLSTIVQMPDYPKLATLIMGSCPGGSLSNVTTFWVNGSLTLSIAMSTVSSIAAMAIMPVLMIIYSNAFDSAIPVPFGEISVILATLTIPVGIGMLFKWKWPVLAEKIKRLGGIIGLIATTASAITLAAIFGKTWVIIWQFPVICFLLPILGGLLAYGVAHAMRYVRIGKIEFKQPEENCRAIAIETGVQNTQLAVAIINLSPTFSEKPCIQAEMAVMPLLYLCVQTIWCFVLIGSYKYYVRKVRKEQPEKYQKALEQNIEIAEDEKATTFERAVARRKSAIVLTFSDSTDKKEARAELSEDARNKLKTRRNTVFDKFNRNKLASMVGAAAGAYIPIVDPEIEEAIEKSAVVGERTDKNGVRRRSVYFSTTGILTKIVLTP